MKVDRTAFFATVRARLGKLSTSQVAGIEAILDVIDGAPLSHQAYMLATAWHETAATMKPIKEYGGPSYFTKMYDVAGNRPQLCISMGNTCAGDGLKYFGRGYVQLTWKVNYERAGRELGLDLVAQPDLALEPAAAAAILCLGMTEGWFTRRKLATYLPAQGVATRLQYVNARKIINGTDKAELVEDYAQAFERALRDGGLS